MEGTGEVDVFVVGSLLRHLDPPEQSLLLEPGVRRVFGANEVLLRYGDPTDHVLLLVRGWVRVSVSARDGQEILFALRGPGDVLGDLAALHGWPRTATVRAIDDVVVVQLTGPQFVSILHRRPTVAIAMVKQMSSRLREAEAARVDVVTLGVSQRVAAYLQRLAEEHGVRCGAHTVIGMPLSQQDIANRVGASRRAVARSMRMLRDRQIIRTSRRRIEITRPDVLRSFVRSVPHGT